MKAKLKIKSFADIDGIISDKLTVDVGGHDICSVITSNPMTVDCVIEKLELLAFLLKESKENGVI